MIEGYMPKVCLYRDCEEKLKPAKTHPRKYCEEHAKLRKKEQAAQWHKRNYEALKKDNTLNSDLDREGHVGAGGVWQAMNRALDQF